MTEPLFDNTEDDSQACVVMSTQQVRSLLEGLKDEIKKLEQIFLPYVIIQSGKTLYEAMVDRHFQLGPGQGEVDEPS